MQQPNCVAQSVLKKMGRSVTIQIPSPNFWGRIKRTTSFDELEKFFTERRYKTFDVDLAQVFKVAETVCDFANEFPSAKLEFAKKTRKFIWQFISITVVFSDYEELTKFRRTWRDEMGWRINTL